MSRHHLVRVGALGQVGRFAAVDSARYPRHARVIVRTPRGLEVGEVLAPPDDDEDIARADGSILRGMTVEDHLLESRLNKNRQMAFDACVRSLSDRNLPVALMDAEQLFDGRTLVFYFLGESTPELEVLTAELAELYETQAQVRRFADTMTHGCGPGCGTEAAAGTGCATCATGCAVSGACTTRH